jgi:5,10-methenyltetrahydrofolate synthetase
LKAELRKDMIARRDALPEGERARISRTFLEKIATLPQYAGAKSVLATMSIGSEWDTRLVIDHARAHGKSVVLPRISAPPRRLELYAVADFDRDLVPGVWNIPQPDPARCRQVDFSRVDFALVPALAADREGYRLGYGAGYFDKLLSGRHDRPYCVTALPAQFILDRVPREAHDIPVDLVIDDTLLLGGNAR